MIGGNIVASETILEGKKAIVAEIVDKMKNAQAFVLVDYKGINVEQDTAFRKNAREADVDYKLYKNTFLRLAAKECGYDELVDALKGSTAVGFCNSDVVAPAKVVSEFAKSNDLECLTIKGGVIEGSIASLEELQKIATLPSREALLAKMLGSLQAPISNFACVINAIKEKKEEDEQASA